MLVRMTHSYHETPIDSRQVGSVACPDAQLIERISILENRIQRLSAENSRLNRQWHEATTSISWQLVHKLSKSMRLAAPPNTCRRTHLKGLWRGLISARRNGPLAWFMRTSAQLKSKIVNLLDQILASKSPFFADERPLILAISHIGGGGTERHIRDISTRLLNEGVRTIYTRPDQNGKLIFEERDANWKLHWRRAIKPESDQLPALIKKLKPCLAHVHHTLNVPDILFKSIQSRSIPMDWTLHDYHSICPRIHLHNQSGFYCGEPDNKGCNSCLKKDGDYHGRPIATPINDYRAQWSSRLAKARRIYVPSDDIKNRLARYLPNHKIDVRPHLEPARPSQQITCVKRVLGEAVRVAVIGAIGSIKGSAMLLTAARDVAERSLPMKFVLVGTSSLEPQLLATGCVELTGAYHEHEIWDRLENAACHLAWLPSLWPETYMYTLSVAQLARMWPVVYDIGAQSDRVRNTSIGSVLELNTPVEKINDLFIERADTLATLPELEPPEYAEYPNFVSDYYGVSIEQLKSLAKPDSLGYETEMRISSQANPSPHASRSDRARLHQYHNKLST
ncbi:MAG: hypothetical protein DWI24_10640 [Planctomycetota bacterium]|nr:MAG: hypothetical protein DWI24_10640 [Planctomycetota bacterium]